MKRLELDLRAEGPRKRPVVLRILLNASGTGYNGAASRAETMQALVRALNALALDPKLVTWELSVHFQVLTAGLHSKVLIVDGARAIITGANMNHWDNYDWGEQYLGGEYE